MEKGSAGPTGGSWEDRDKAASVGGGARGSLFPLPSASSPPNRQQGWPPRPDRLQGSLPALPPSYTAPLGSDEAHPMHQISPGSHPPPTLARVM